MNIRTIVSASHPARDGDCNPIVTQDELAAERAQEDRAIRRRAAAGTSLVASIKSTSRYYGQGTKGARFPVFIQAWDESSAQPYFVRGGPGGQYRLVDVNLFAVVGDTEVQLT